MGRPVAGHCEIQGCGRGTPLKAKPGAQEHQSEMDLADSGLEGRVESVYHSARRANATALTEIPFTHNAGHTRAIPTHAVNHDNDQQAGRYIQIPAMAASPE